MSACGGEPDAYEDDGPTPGAWCARLLGNAGPARLRRLLPAAGRAPDPDDPRFADPAWTRDPYFRRLRQGYLLGRQLVLTAAEAPGLSAHRRQQARFLAQVLTDALAPTNFLAGNPAALRRAASTRGASLFRGAGNLFDDLVHRRGRPAKVPPGSYRLGEDLAATPGRVVYRNDLMEVLQYGPQTAEVHRVPLLLVPAWVNKFYIFDLSPGRSVAEWAVREGFTVFAVSFRDPGPEQAGLGLDVYFRRVALRALDVVREITGEPRAHLVGACAGGMLAAVTAAWLAAEDADGVASLTLLMSAMDFPAASGDARPSAAEISLLARAMSTRQGLVAGARIGILFDLMRSTDTIWRPLVAGWLLGERPGPLDIWAWSEDGIGVPRVLFEQTLRITAENSLARGVLRVGGRTIDLSTATQDAFVVAGSRDHIIPWETVYHSARLLGGEVAFHLVPSGHVGGLVSPPRARAAYRGGPVGLPASPRDWSAASSEHQESWWQAWSRWLAPRSGPRVPGRLPGSERHPPLDPAPGRYVRSR